MSSYRNFALLGYAEHQSPHGNISHSYRIVNPAAQVKEYFFSGVRSTKSKRVIDYKQSSDPTSFQNFLRAHPVAFVWFHASWCRHCVDMEDYYNQVADTVLNVSFIKVDVDDNQPLVAYYNIRGFPTLKLFINGQPTEEYEGKRTAAAFIEWLKQRV